MQELTQDNLQEIITQNPYVIVQYGASWCGVCRRVKPKFVALAQEHQNVVFIYADAEQFPQSRDLADIENLPTFAGFAHGKLVKQAMGSKEEAIKEVIHEITSH